MIEFPHVKYISGVSLMDEHTPYTTEMKYIGDDEDNFVFGKNYKFVEMMYSPNKETEYKKVLVCLDEKGNYKQLDESKPEFATLLFKGV